MALNLLVIMWTYCWKHLSFH